MDSDEFHAEFFDFFADAILVIDGEGRIRFASSASLEILGYEPMELIGETVEKLVPADNPGHTRLRKLYTDAPKARGMGSGLDLVAIRKDGRPIPVDITLSPFARDGERLVAAAVRDMSGRRTKDDILHVQVTALESAANGIVITNRDGIITWVNPAACSMTGYAMDELVGEHTRILKSGKHPPDTYKELWDTVLRGQVWSGTIINRRKDGSFYHEEQTIAPVVDDDGEISHFVAIKQDISIRVRLEQELERLARIDALTGCANRHHLLEASARELGRAKRFGYPVSVIVFDLDRFKSINDRFGHATGDDVLRAFVRHARDNLRDHDIIGRLGGEEFVAVLPHAESAGAFAVAERIRECFGGDSTLLPNGESVTVSAGIVEVEPGGGDIDRALQDADTALYEAKNAGRDSVVCAP
jgi:diguanylate cyclase (GGDEF)-like protein/PAS domain S-box-containing protein